MKKAVVLLSGGLDSSTALYYAKSKGYRCICLIFDYGQRHRREIESAKRIAKRARCNCEIIKISLPWKGSSLLDKKMKLPITDYRLPITIPSTYVPSRNIIFLSFALSYAEAIGAGAIFIGANAIDYSGYPDCRPEFFKAFRKVVASGTRIGSPRSEAKPLRRGQVKIETPLIRKSKKEIVRLAKHLNVPLNFTWSCYKGNHRPCGVCDSCILRAKGFREAGIEDPLWTPPLLRYSIFKNRSRYKCL